MLAYSWHDGHHRLRVCVSVLTAWLGKEQSTSVTDIASKSLVSKVDDPVLPIPALQVTDPSLSHFSAVSGVESLLLEQINAGFAKQPPQLIGEGLGGTYLLFDPNGIPTAIWKPSDEEPAAEGNPKERQPDRSGFTAGTGYLREVAAFQLGHSAGVPETILVKSKEGKIGSLQRYVENAGSVEEYGPSKYAVEDVHRIGLLDLRLLNTDRHGGNILVQDPTCPKLNPIDHGYCFGNVDSLRELLDFEWLHWPQSKQPLSEELKAEIMSSDLDQEVKVLEELGCKEDVIQLHTAAAAFVRLAVSKDWTVFRMGQFVTRPEPDTASAFETLCRAAMEEADVLTAFKQKLERLVA